MATTQPTSPKVPSYTPPPKGKGSLMKIALVLLALAVLAAGIVGLVIGLDKRDSNSTPSTSAVDGSTTTNRDTGTTAGTGTTSSTSGTSATTSTDPTSTGTTKDTCAAEDASCTVDNGTASTDDCLSAYDVVTGTPELSTFATVVEGAGLTATASDKTWEASLLAVSNSAFAKIPQDELTQLTADVNKLTNVLNLHIAPGSVAAASLANGAKLPVAGGVLDVAVATSVSFTTADGFSTATVTTADIKTCKGVVHIIDTLLLTSDLAPSPSPAEFHANGIQKADDGTYPVCAGEWGQMNGTEPCGIRVGPTGTVELGEYFGGVIGVFGTDAAVGEIDSCFITSVAQMFEQQICEYDWLNVDVVDATGAAVQEKRIECLPSETATTCACVAPFAQKAIDSQIRGDSGQSVVGGVISDKKWAGNIGLNSFLQILLAKAKPQTVSIEAANAGGRVQNKLKVEKILTELLSVSACPDAAATS